MESIQITLTPERFLILHDLISRGMEEKFAPFDDIETDAETEQIIAEELEAVAFFSAHAITHGVNLPV